MQLVTRADWGAPADTPAADLPTAQGVKVHWIGGPHDSGPQHGDQCAAEVLAIRQEHLADPVQHWVDIAYNFVVCQHGYVFEGRGLRKESGANGNQPLNLAHYAVCAIQGTNEQASDALKSGLRDAIEYLQANGAGGEILGHRDGYSTDCPGDELYSWVHAGAPRPGGAVDPQPAPVPAPDPQPAPVVSGPEWPGEYLRLGSTGDNVRTAQQRLADRGWTITVDGDFGPQTDRVVRAFQNDSTANGWPLTADGVIGPKTWAALWNRPIS